MLPFGVSRRVLSEVRDDEETKSPLCVKSPMAQAGHLNQKTSLSEIPISLF